MKKKYRILVSVVVLILSSITLSAQNFNENIKERLDTLQSITVIADSSVVRSAGVVKVLCRFDRKNRIRPCAKPHLYLYLPVPNERFGDWKGHRDRFLHLRTACRFENCRCRRSCGHCGIA